METRRITWWALGALMIGLVGGAWLARAEVTWLERLAVHHGACVRRGLPVEASLFSSPWT